MLKILILFFRQLGFDDGVAISYSKFGYVEPNFVMDDVHCKGDEEKIQDCSYTKNHNCGATEAAGVECNCRFNLFSIENLFF